MKGPDSIQRTKQGLELNGILNANQISHLQHKRESSPTLWLRYLEKLKKHNSQAASLY
jgi:hypothetical protein